jgi:hypothetical protein
MKIEAQLNAQRALTRAGGDTNNAVDAHQEGQKQQREPTSHDFLFCPVSRLRRRC